MYFDGSTATDIDNTLLAAIEAVEYGLPMPSNLYFFIYTIEGSAYISYSPTTAVSGNLAIFTYTSYNPSSMTYTVYTNYGDPPISSNINDGRKDAPSAFLP